MYFISSMKVMHFLFYLLNHN